MICIALTACKSDSENSIRNQQNESFQLNSEDLSNFENLDLRTYEINASIMVPKDESTSVKHQLDSFDWIIKQGKQSYLSIEDWGTADGLNHFIEEIKKQTEEIEIIENSDDFVFYKKTVGTSQTTYHAAAQHNIEGVNYLFITAKQGFSEDGVKAVVASIKSVELRP
ncbi:hypothetical protein DXU93_09775 [Brumimicrobium aurantiacum]|uniref:DUF4252 domain-containing protein n=2 Tax=Brumimicrobium aurantiacum TaxID=1737063 RepID=A0A3E1EXJ2_9FLAO|nr:hypothetical protein DXU93_09775 [Brumimicrobium aurantiacum]